MPRQRRVKIWLSAVESVFVNANVARELKRNRQIDAVVRRWPLEELRLKPAAAEKYWKFWRWSRTSGSERVLMMGSLLMSRLPVRGDLRSASREGKQK